LISRSFLEWAAAGQLVAPVHALLRAVSERDRPGATRAVTQLGSIGASSGADLAFGLSIGLEMLAPRSGEWPSTIEAVSQPLFTLPPAHR
jgi:hypothetical protein